jgi:hypothetical protein
VARFSDWRPTGREVFYQRYDCEMTRFLLLLLLDTTALYAQLAPARPSFEDYPAKQIYQGAPALPILNKDQRSYRTRIREGAKSPVQFAGHYTLPNFGCGTECSAFFIVDSITGKVYDGFSVADLPGRWIEKQTGDPPFRIQFIASSCLLKINGCPNEHDCGYYDYVMVDGKGLKLVDKWLLPEKFQ